jgi:hypothetical protein
MPTRLKAALAFIAIVTAAGPAWAQHRAAPPVRHAANPRPDVIRPASDDNLQSAASVVQISELRRQGDLTVKLFGTAGGDPAMNGLYTYIAFNESPADGWRIFRLGDFLSYRILSETPGRLSLEVRESIMNERTGDIGTRVRRLRVGWTAGRSSASPATVSVAAVR